MLGRFFRADKGAGDAFTAFLHALGPAFGGPENSQSDPRPAFVTYRHVLLDPSFGRRLQAFGQEIASEQTDILRKLLGTQGLVWLYKWLDDAADGDSALRPAADAARAVAELAQSAKVKDGLFLDFFEEFMRAPDADEQTVILRYVSILEDSGFRDWLMALTDRHTKKSTGERKKAAAA